MRRLVISRWNMIVRESVVLGLILLLIMITAQFADTDCKQQSLIQKATLTQWTLRLNH